MQDIVPLRYRFSGKQVCRHRHKLRQTCFLYGKEVEHPIIGFVRSLLARVPFLSGNDLGLILSYFLIASITLFAVLGVYWVLARVTPRILSVLCGGRAS